MHGLIAVLLLGAAPEKLGALGFSHANVSAEVAEVAADHFAQQLARQGFKVVTPKELAALIGQERQRQLLGCADGDSSCLAELTSALGTDALVTGSLGRFGQRFTVNIKVTRSTNGATLATFSSEVGSEDELPATLSRAAADIAEQLRPVAKVPGTHRALFAVGYGVSAVALVIGAVFLGIAGDAWSRLGSQDETVGDAFRHARVGSQTQGPGWLLLGVGGALTLVTSVLMMALSESASVGAAR